MTAQSHESGTTFRQDFDIPAAPGRVFDALIEPRHLEKWLADRVEVKAILEQPPGPVAVRRRIARLDRGWPRRFIDRGR